MSDKTLREAARQQAGGLDNWADVLEAHEPDSSAKGILMLRAAAKTLRELVPNVPEGSTVYLVLVDSVEWSEVMSSEARVIYEEERAKFLAEISLDE